MELWARERAAEGRLQGGLGQSEKFKKRLGYSQTCKAISRNQARPWQSWVMPSSYL